jgi:transposase
MEKRKDDQRLIILAEHINRSGARIQDVANKIGVTNRTIYNWLGNIRSRVSPLASRRLDLYLKRIAREV